MPLPPRTSFAVIMAAVSLSTAFALGWVCRPAAVPAAPAPSSSAAAATSSSVPTHAATFPTPLPSDATPQTFDEIVAAPVSGYRQRLRLALAASGLDRAAVVAELEHEHTRDPVGYANRVWPTEALLNRFAELDPAAAMAWLVQTYRGDKLSYSWQSVVMEAWIAQDHKGALKWVRGLPPGPLRVTFAGMVLGPLSDVDPEMAIREATRLSKSGNDYSFSYRFTNLFTQLAEKDLPTARERALALPAAQAGRAVEGVMAFWAQHQPEDAYAWAQQLPAGKLRDGAMSKFYQTLAGNSPADAAAWLTTHGNADLTKEISTVAQAWAKQDVAAACAWSENLPMHARQEALSQIAIEWSNTDPRAALEYALSARLLNEHNGVLPNALNRWSRQDPLAAADWVEKSVPAARRKQALQNVCSSWAQQDPRACVEYLSQLPPATGSAAESNYALSNAVSQWAYESPEDAWQWSQNVTDPKIRESAVESALSNFARTDPAQAIARMGLLPQESQASAASTIASQWASTDPAAALGWVNTLPTEEMQTQTRANVLRNWASNDAPGAAAWADAQPPGAGRDSAVAAVLNSGSTDLDPVVAARLAMSLQDPQQRLSSLSQTVRQWIEQDRPAAEAWVGQAQGFTAEQRAQLLGSSHRMTWTGN